MYYNTTNQTGQTLMDFTVKAEKQDDKVLAIFKRYQRPMSASQVWRIYGADEAPITSIRRSVTNLFKSGVLEKTEKKCTGIWGRDEYYYQLSYNT